MSDKIADFMKRHPFPKIVGVHPIWTAQKISEEEQKIEREMNQVMGKCDTSDGSLYCYRCPVKMKERPHPTKPYVLEMYCEKCGFSFEVLTLDQKKSTK